MKLIKAEESDYYGDDGLLYCGKCKTRKQVRVMLMGEETTPYCLCKCEIEQREREEAEYRRRRQKERAEELRRNGFPEANMRHCTFDCDDGSNEQIIRIAKKYVDNFDLMQENGKGLLMFGTVGCGKTFASVCIANELIDRGHPCLVTNFSRLINTVSGMYEGKQDYIDSLNRFDLIVIDDLATEADTDYRNEIVYNIIDNRCRAKLPLIVTTNLTAQELKRTTDVKKQRIYSRLFDACVPVEVKGQDHRRTNLKKGYNEFAEILGIDPNHITNKDRKQ